MSGGVGQIASMRQQLHEQWLDQERERTRRVEEERMAFIEEHERLMEQQRALNTELQDELRELQHVRVGQERREQRQILEQSRRRLEQQQEELEMKREQRAAALRIQQQVRREQARQRHERRRAEEADLARLEARRKERAEDAARTRERARQRTAALQELQNQAADPGELDALTGLVCSLVADDLQAGGGASASVTGGATAAAARGQLRTCAPAPAKTLRLPPEAATKLADVASRLQQLTAVLEGETLGLGESVGAGERLGAGNRHGEPKACQAGNSPQSPRPLVCNSGAQVDLSPVRRTIEKFEAQACQVDLVHHGGSEADGSRRGGNGQSNASKTIARIRSRRKKTASGGKQPQPRAVLARPKVSASSVASGASPLEETAADPYGSESSMSEGEIKLSY